MAPEGIELIKKLVSYADGRIIIMPGAGIDKNNIAEIAGNTGVVECHITARSILESRMKYKKRWNIYGRLTTDS